MAAKCDICGKGPGFGHKVSHSNIKTKRRFNPNIQRVKALLKVLQNTLMFVLLAFVQEKFLVN